MSILRSNSRANLSKEDGWDATFQQIAAKSQELFEELELEVPENDNRARLVQALCLMEMVNLHFKLQRNNNSHTKSRKQRRQRWRDLAKGRARVVWNQQYSDRK